MVLSLIFGKKYAQSRVGLITFDTMVSEEHKFTSRVTYFPVESGTIVSDHILLQPDIVILSGLISDTPLNVLAPYNRSISAFNALLYIFENRQIVTVVTGIKIYQNMAITSLDVPRTIRTGQTLTFHITLQRIIFDDTLQVLTTPGNLQSGVQDNTPASIVKDSTTIPYFQSDPQYSLADQAASAINTGVQSLNNIPTSILPNILLNLPLILGV